MLPPDATVTEVIRKVLVQRVSRLVDCENKVDELVHAAILRYGTLRAEFSWEHKRGLLCGGIDNIWAQFAGAAVFMLPKTDLMSYIGVAIRTSLGAVRDIVQRALNAREGPLVGHRVAAAGMADAARYFLNGSTKFLDHRFNPVAAALIWSQQRTSLPHLSRARLNNVLCKTSISGFLADRLQNTFTRCFRPKRLAQRLHESGEVTATFSRIGHPLGTLDNMQKLARGCVLAYVAKTFSVLGLHVPPDVFAQVQILCPSVIAHRGRRVTKKAYSATQVVRWLWNAEKRKKKDFCALSTELLAARVHHMGGMDEFYDQLAAQVVALGVQILMSSNDEHLFIRLQWEAAPPPAEGTAVTDDIPASVPVRNAPTDMPDSAVLWNLPYADFQIRYILRIMKKAVLGNAFRRLTVQTFRNSPDCLLVDMFHGISLRNKQSVRQRLKDVFPAWDRRARMSEKALETAFWQCLRRNKFGRSLEFLDAQESNDASNRRFVERRVQRAVVQDREYVPDSAKAIVDAFFAVTTPSHLHARPRGHPGAADPITSETDSRDSASDDVEVQRIADEDETRQALGGPGGGQWSEDEGTGGTAPAEEEHDDSSVSDQQQREQQPATARECSLIGCRNPTRAKRLCALHYQRRRISVKRHRRR